MIKCLNCKNHKVDGIKHICNKCETKIVYGQLQDVFIECCPYFWKKVDDKKRCLRNKA